MACRASKLVRSRGPQRGSRAAPECWWPRLSPVGGQTPGQSGRHPASCPRASRHPGRQEPGARPTTVTCSSAALGRCSTHKRANGWVRRTWAHGQGGGCAGWDARRGWTRQDGARTPRPRPGAQEASPSSRGAFSRDQHLRVSQPPPGIYYSFVGTGNTGEGLYRSTSQGNCPLKIQILGEI